MTKTPSEKAVSFRQLGEAYGAVSFEKALRFIAEYNNPHTSPRDLPFLADVLPLMFDNVWVYHKAKFWESDFCLYRNASDEYDVVHCTPARRDRRGHEIPGRFDTALINDGTGGHVGVHCEYLCCSWSQN